MSFAVYFNRSLNYFCIHKASCRHYRARQPNNDESYWVEFAREEYALSYMKRMRDWNQKLALRGCGDCKTTPPKVSVAD